MLFAASSSEDTTAEPYDESEFPQYALDLRRTEIITFGSIPFVLLQTTIVYSFWRYYDHDFSSDYIPNPLAKSSSAAGLDTDEQKMLLKSTAAICVGLGITDLIIQLIKRHKSKSRAKKNAQNAMQPITIEAVDEEENESFYDEPPLPPELEENISTEEDKEES
ncbi:MAG: hypothetical protein K6F69_03320 [Treponema sp.]|nr:hypothetical protein [Treponema sp.]